MFLIGPELLLDSVLLQSLTTEYVLLKTKLNKIKLGKAQFVVIGLLIQE